MVEKYIPKQGDICYMDFDPVKGHEQKGYRPALVISNNVFNINTRMVIVFPITSNEKEFPTHHLLKSTEKIHGSILCEHIRGIDYEVRHLKFIERISEDEFEDIINLLNACIDS